MTPAEHLRRAQAQAKRLADARQVAERWRRQLRAGALPVSDVLLAEMQLICAALLDS